jgi:hypothetical protein
MTLLWGWLVGDQSPSTMAAHSLVIPLVSTRVLSTHCAQLLCQKSGWKSRGATAQVNNKQINQGKLRTWP